YVHRVGRTGRMGREGIAFTFVTADEGQQLTAIEHNINRLLIQDSLDGEVAPSQARQAAAAAAEVAATADAELEAPRKKRLFPMKRKVNARLARLGARK